MAVCTEKETQCREYPGMENYESTKSFTAGMEVVRKNASAARERAKGVFTTHLRSLVDQLGAGPSDLTVHLRCLIDREDTSDLEFVCKDQISMRACRIFLLGRSSFFDKLLTNGMLETTSSVIHVPEISSAALLSILEFLYTGNILQYGPKDWNMGLEVMSAARFFLLPDVDEIVQDYLVTQIHHVASNFRKLAVMLTTAMTFKILPHDKDIILLQLVRLLEWQWMDAYVARSLSEEALEFVLRHSKAVSTEEERMTSSLVEYFRFRGVVLWCLCTSHLQIGSSEEEANHTVNGATPQAMPLVKTSEFANQVTPALEENGLVSTAAAPAHANGPPYEAMPPKEANRLVGGAIPLDRKELYSYSRRATESSSMDLTWLPNHNAYGPGSQDELIQFLQSHEASKEAAMRLLVHIDWVRLPAALFVKVVEPLELVPGPKLVDTFRFHALHRAVRVKLNWVHSENYKVQSDEFTIEKIQGYRGSAMCLLANRESDPVCVWRFTVEELESDVQPGVQLGFLCATGLERAKRIWDFQRICSEALRHSAAIVWARVIRWTGHPRASSMPGKLQFLHVHGRAIGHDSEPSVLTADVTTFQRVEFRFHRKNRSCDVTVDDKDFPRIWNGLGDERVFPVVSLRGFSRGRVRLDIISGFEIL